MEKIKERFGFGYMRLPMKQGEVDVEKTCEMVDAFMQAGFNYFDTAHGYTDGKSEGAVKACISSRYPREAFVLTDKLTGDYFKAEQDIRPLFESQLAACGVEYFDFYLMHAQTAESFAKFKACRAYETAFALKNEGKVRHVGISFHDKPEVLEAILTEYPQLEVVQLQFNYVDFEDPAVQSRACYEVCRKFSKPVIVMEPAKGGNLVKLPPKAKEVFDALGGGSPASYALRFAAGFEGIRMVLSGMNDLAQVQENTAFMKDPRPLDAQEQKAIGNVREIFRAMNLIACTGCRYCAAGCPQKLPIADMFAAMNAQKRSEDNWNAGYYYNICTAGRGRACDCIECGACEQSCPQHLPIRALLKTVSAEFDQQENA